MRKRNFSPYPTFPCGGKVRLVAPQSSFPCWGGWGSGGPRNNLGSLFGPWPQKGKGTAFFLDGEEVCSIGRWVLKTSKPPFPSPPAIFLSMFSPCNAACYLHME